MAGVTGAALMALWAPTAYAVTPVPFTIAEDVDFSDGGVNTFTATGPLCSSGTFVDDVTAVGGGHSPLPKANLLIESVYTCADGSGTFNMTKHVFLAVNDDGSSTNTGPISLHGGTGRYTALSGHGVDNGHAEGDNGVGQISGVIVGP